MPTYRLDLAYDGSGFHGYARQPKVRTIQGELEGALVHHTGPVETFVAGRTDKGVHASGQVASFRADRELDVARVARSLNRQLGPAIAVLRLFAVDDNFHARFSATARRYRYRILTREAPDPFLAAVSWHYAGPLDIAEMNAAAAHFVGEIDFSSLCRRAGDAATTRRVRLARWVNENGELLDYLVEASSFCHQMVRSMVAICVDVGRGKVDVGDVPLILSARDRRAGRGAAPAHGLTLLEVKYESSGATAEAQET